MNHAAKQILLEIAEDKNEQGEHERFFALCLEYGAWSRSNVLPKISVPLSSGCHVHRKEIAISDEQACLLDRLVCRIKQETLMRTPYQAFVERCLNAHSDSEEDLLALERLKRSIRAEGLKPTKDELARQCGIFVERLRTLLIATLQSTEPRRLY